MDLTKESFSTIGPSRSEWFLPYQDNVLVVLNPMRARMEADLRGELARLTELQRVQMLERKVASLPTWPFDIQAISKFITIVLSVTAVLLSRLITDFLHI